MKLNMNDSTQVLILSNETYKLVVKYGYDTQAIIDHLPAEHPDIIHIKTATRRFNILSQKTKDCIDCQENLRKNHCICSKHWHDYCDCKRDDCLTCLLIARNPYMD